MNEEHDKVIKEVIAFLKKEAEETPYVQKNLKIEKLLKKLSKYYTGENNGG